MLSFHNVSRKMAVIETTGGGQIVITRSRADGTTVGFSSHVTGFKTVHVEELLMALTYVTKTDEELEALGADTTTLPKATRPKRKRTGKLERDNPFL